MSCWLTSLMLARLSLMNWTCRALRIPFLMLRIFEDSPCSGDTSVMAPFLDLKRRSWAWSSTANAWVSLESEYFRGTVLPWASQSSTESIWNYRKEFIKTWGIFYIIEIVIEKLNRLYWMDIFCELCPIDNKASVETLNLTCAEFKWAKVIVWINLHSS